MSSGSGSAGISGFFETMRSRTKDPKGFRQKIERLPQRGREEHCFECKINS